MFRSLKAVPLSVGLATLALAPGAQSQTNTNLFPISFRAVCTSTNAEGIFREQVLNTNLVTDCAADHNITNLDSLSLVYNRTNDSIQVVDSNGVAICTSFAFTGGLAFTNTNNTQIVFQRNVTVGTNLTASGVISGVATWNNTNLANSFGLRAELFYIEPALGTNAPAICRAVLRVGAAVNKEPERHDNGKHLGWQVPQNPHNPQNPRHDNGNHNGWQNPQNPNTPPGPPIPPGRRR
jgi:hypothetical protein